LTTCVGRPAKGTATTPKPATTAQPCADMPSWNHAGGGGGARADEPAGPQSPMTAPTRPTNPDLGQWGPTLLPLCGHVPRVPLPTPTGGNTYTTQARYNEQGTRACGAAHLSLEARWLSGQGSRREGRVGLLRVKVHDGGIMLRFPIPPFKKNGGFAP
jgi:hypothetical protein